MTDDEFISADTIEFAPEVPPIGDDGWEQPVQLLAHAEPPEFPLDAFPRWARDWVTEISAEKGASPDIAANLFLALVSGALARQVQVQPRPGWWEPTNLYVILGLAPGQRKTPVFKDALRPARRVERRRINEHVEHARAQTLAIQMHEKRERNLLNDVDADANPEQLLERLGERPPEPAAAPRLLTEDVTPEGLAGLIGDHGRIIVASDEGSALFENLAGRYARGSTSYDLFNKAHAGTDLVVDRKGSVPVNVFDPALTVGIVTQPALLRSIATKPDAGGRGLLARPLYSLPRPVFADGPTSRAREDVTAEYARRIVNLFSDVPELRTDEDGVPAPTVVGFAADAREVFETWERKINAERKRLGAADDDEGDEGLFLGWLSKLAGHTARLAVDLHAAEYWTNGSAVTTTIDVTVTKQAIQLGEYYWRHALIVFGLMGELPVQRRARTILGWLRTQGEPVITVRDVHRSRGGGTKVEHVREALKLIEDHGWVRLAKQEPMPQGGRPSELVHLHPEISRTEVTKATEPRQEGGFGTSVRPDPGNISKSDEASGDVRARPSEDTGGEQTATLPPEVEAWIARAEADGILDAE